MTTFSDEIPPQGQLLGVDYGTKRVGLAISTGDQTLSSPLQIYERRNERLDAKFFRELAEDYRLKGIVVGLPMHINGEEGESARHARAYGTWLSELTGLPVIYWDERYTSAVAEEHLLNAEMTRKQRKKRLDKIAAHIILQACLDFRHRARNPPDLPQEPTPE